MRSVVLFALGSGTLLMLMMSAFGLMEFMKLFPLNVMPLTLMRVRSYVVVEIGMEITSRRISAAAAAERRRRAGGRRRTGRRGTRGRRTRGKKRRGEGRRRRKRGGNGRRRSHQGRTIRDRNHLVGGKFGEIGRLLLMLLSQTAGRYSGTDPSLMGRRLLRRS